MSDDIVVHDPKAMDALVEQAVTERNPVSAKHKSSLVRAAPEPWPDPVDGDSLLSEIWDLVNEHVVVVDAAKTATSLWTVHTYAIDAADVSPLLLITSPEKRCGKTTMLRLVAKLVHRPLTASNIAPAALYRSVEAWQPTLLIDEADTFLKSNEDLRGILNAGHTRDTAYVVKCEGEKFEPKQFSSWCAKLVAMIGKPRDTLVDRAIDIQLARKTRSERTARLRDLEPEYVIELQRRLLRFAIDNHDTLVRARPELPRELDDRAADNWEALIAIADVVGGSWPAQARKAAVELSMDREDEEGAVIQLFRDVASVFDRDSVDKLHTVDLLNSLIGLEGSPWKDWNKGRGLTPYSLARLFKAFKIRPTQIKIDGKNRNGYELKQFRDAFLRYTPPKQTSTPLQASNDAVLRGIPKSTVEIEVEDSNPLKPSNGAGRRGVEDAGWEQAARDPEAVAERLAIQAESGETP